MGLVEAARRQAQPCDTLLQVAIWCRNLRGDPPLRYHLDMATQTAIALAALAWAAISPRGYMKWRTWIIVAARLAFYLPQSSRRLAGAPIALERPADARALGVLVDGWRLMLGEPACLPTRLPARPPASLQSHLAVRVNCLPAPQAPEFLWCFCMEWCFPSGSPCSWWYTQRRSG